MRAAISGRAALAVLEQDGRWYSLHYDDLSQLVPRAVEMLPLLLRGVQDIEWLEADSIDAVKDRLADSVDSTEGLDLVLYLLDATLSDDTRKTAALEFEDLAVYPEVIALIEDILLAEPLPAAADMSGALAACDRAGATHTRAWLTQWESLQPQVERVAITWRALSDDLIGQVRETATAACLKFGVFRTLVRSLSQYGNARPAKLTLVGNRRLKSAFPNIVRTLNEWTRRIGDSRVDVWFHSPQLHSSGDERMSSFESQPGRVILNSTTSDIRHLVGNAIKSCNATVFLGSGTSVSSGRPLFRTVFGKLIDQAKPADVATETLNLAKRFLSIEDYVACTNILRQYLGKECKVHLSGEFNQVAIPVKMRHLIANLPSLLVNAPDYGSFLEAAYGGSVNAALLNVDSAIPDEGFCIFNTRGDAGIESSQVRANPQRSGLNSHNLVFNKYVDEIFAIGTFLFVGFDFRDRSILPLVGAEKRPLESRFGRHFAMFFNEVLDLPCEEFLKTNCEMYVIRCNAGLAKAAVDRIVDVLSEIGDKVGVVHRRCGIRLMLGVGNNNSASQGAVIEDSTALSLVIYADDGCRNSTKTP